MILHKRIENIIIKVRVMKLDITWNKSNQGSNLTILIQVFKCKDNRIIDVSDDPDTIQTHLSGITGIYVIDCGGAHRYLWCYPWVGRCLKLHYRRDHVVPHVATCAIYKDVVYST